MAKKKKRNKTRIKKAPFVIIFLILAAALIFHHFDYISEKAKKFSPNAFTYPTKYEEYVIKYSNEFEIDPRYIYAVINNESQFYPDAT